MLTLPKVIATSVIRSTYKGESHGGVYIIDFSTSDYFQVMDWNKMEINWEGRGLDRGLRGIAFQDDKIYIAASDEIFIFDRNFKQLGSICNRYLKHCHEIFIEDNILYLTSTGFDSVLLFDLAKGSFINGYCMRFGRAKGFLNRFNIKNNGKYSFFKFTPYVKMFNPNSEFGPSPMDSLHINNVHVKDKKIFVSGTRVAKLLLLSRDQGH